MSIFFFLFVCFPFFFPLTGADDCKPDRCGKRGPLIQFPFRISSRQLPNCSYPGFDVYCNDKNEPMLDLPGSVGLKLNKIDYLSQQLFLSDPDKCLAKKLQNLNISSSPFSFSFLFNGLRDYVLFNCSDSKPDLDFPVPCLSHQGNQFFAVDNNSYMDTLSLTSCTRLNTIPSVPWGIFSGNDFLLNWSKPACSRDCEKLGKRCIPSNGGFLCVDKPKSNKESLRNKRIAAGTVGSFFMVITVAVTIYLCVSFIKDRENRKKIEGFLEDYRALKPTRFGYSDIRRITNQFSEKLGEGGYGVVYKGKLSSEIYVAVKVLNNSKENGEEFVNEVSTIGRIHHVNVVRLVGFCAEGFRRVLVYEFLPNESLEKFIFQAESKKLSLGWEKLQDIALGIAKGIEYLHQGCDQQILHFDIKPHNILLDHNFNPKVSDFGLAKLCSKEQSAVTTTAARGTMGYIAPELLSRTFGRVSYKSDVYSFGMLLLEMVGGRKNVDLKENNSQVYFPQWIYNHLNLGDECWANIEEGDQSNIAKKITIVGLYCIQWYPADRPAMKTVVQMLEGDGSDLTMPPNPFPTTNATNLVAGIPERHFQIELPLILENELEDELANTKVDA